MLRAFAHEWLDALLSSKAAEPKGTTVAETFPYEVRP